MKRIRKFQQVVAGIKYSVAKQMKGKKKQDRILPAIQKKKRYVHMTSKIAVL